MRGKTNVGWGEGSSKKQKDSLCEEGVVGSLLGKRKSFREIEGGDREHSEGGKKHSGGKSFHSTRTSRRDKHEIRKGKGKQPSQKKNRQNADGGGNSFTIKGQKKIKPGKDTAKTSPEKIAKPKTRKP